MGVNLFMNDHKPLQDRSKACLTRMALHILFMHLKYGMLFMIKTF